MFDDPFLASKAQTDCVAEVCVTLAEVRERIQSTRHPGTEAFCEQLAQGIFKRTTTDLCLELADGKTHNQFYPKQKIVTIERISPKNGRWHPVGSRMIYQVAKATDFLWFTEKERDLLAKAGMNARAFVWLNPQLRELALGRIDTVCTRVTRRVQELFEEAVAKKSIHKDLAFHVHRAKYPVGNSCVVKVWIQAKGLDCVSSFLSGGCWHCE
jgi:hypothetical protein